MLRPFLIANKESYIGLALILLNNFHLTLGKVDELTIYYCVKQYFLFFSLVSYKSEKTTFQL